MKIRVPVEKKDSPAPQPEWGKYPETTAYINSVWGEISAYGTKQMPDGRVWVIHGLTNTPVERHKVVPASSDGKGNYIYLRPGEKIPAGAQVFPSVWLNPAHA